MASQKNLIISMITPLDAAHGGIGFLAVANSWWLNFLNPIVQVGITLGGVWYLIYMIRVKRMELKLQRLEYERQLKEKIKY